MEVTTSTAVSSLREQHAIRSRSDAPTEGPLKRSRDDLPQKSQEPVVSGAKLVTWGEIGELGLMKKGEATGAKAC